MNRVADHPTKQPTNQLTSQPTDRPTEQLTQTYELPNHLIEK